MATSIRRLACRRITFAGTSSQREFEAFSVCRRFAFGGFDRIDEQHRDGHRTDAARHRRDVAGHFLDTREIDIAAQLAGFVAIHADVDHGCARLHHVRRENVAQAGGGDHHVGVTGMGGQIARLAMADRDGRAGFEQEQRHGLADDVRAADHHRVRALQRNLIGRQHLHHAVRRARAEQRAAGHQRAGVRNVETVDILFRGDRLDDLVAVDVRRQRQLHQNAVDTRIAVQFVDARQQIGFRQIGRIAVERRAEAVVIARFDLIAHIDFAGRIVADQHDGEAWLMPAGGKSGGAGGDFGAQGLGKG